MTQVLSLVNAFDAFIVGCIDDGTWDSINASCIMAGWSNLSGALTPLAGPQPSGFNLASGEYSRASGLKGDGASMYLSSNVKANAFNISGLHMASFISLSGGSFGDALGYQGNDSLALLRYYSTNNIFNGYMNDTTLTFYSSGVAFTPTFYGFSRNSNTSYTSRVLSSGITHTTTAIPNTPSFNIGVGATILNTGLITAPISYAISFYSIGTPLNLSLLDNRVTVLMSGIQNAIP